MLFLYTTILLGGKTWVCGRTSAHQAAFWANADADVPLLRGRIQKAMYKVCLVKPGMWTPASASRVLLLMFHCQGKFQMSVSYTTIPLGGKTRVCRRASASRVAAAVPFLRGSIQKDMYKVFLVKAGYVDVPPHLWLLLMFYC